MIIYKQVYATFCLGISPTSDSAFKMANWCITHPDLEVWVRLLLIGEERVYLCSETLPGQQCVAIKLKKCAYEVWLIRTLYEGTEFVFTCSWIACEPAFQDPPYMFALRFCRLIEEYVARFGMAGRS